MQEKLVFKLQDTQLHDIPWLFTYNFITNSIEKLNISEKDTVIKAPDDDYSKSYQLSGWKTVTFDYDKAKINWKDAFSYIWKEMYPFFIEKNHQYVIFLYEVHFDDPLKKRSPYSSFIVWDTANLEYMVLPNGQNAVIFGLNDSISKKLLKYNGQDVTISEWLGYID